MKLRHDAGEGVLCYNRVAVMKRSKFEVCSDSGALIASECGGVRVFVVLVDLRESAGSPPEFGVNTEQATLSRWLGCTFVPMRGDGR